ncbi:uncharacterized protein LOC106138246 isoform X2 [Amyelois transitella]|uniref:uncharacterized protein LOC106138246 isoform X2 n=1 Tax=Amyelois transitella TaxID=680683 RepID=UPI002990166D|nr:uncharacterized protein LOC106138246 isoform X2 [Amyelois transitella]
MGTRVKRWYRSRKNQLLIVIFLLGLLMYTVLINHNTQELDLDITKRYIEHKLEEQLKLDKGTGCQMPELDPFAAEVTQFDRDLPRVTCDGQDWVKCYLSECRVTAPILARYGNVTCTYRDILYVSDDVYHIGAATATRGDSVYPLRESDFAKVSCVEENGRLFSIPARWSGHVAGFRSTVAPRPSPPGRENSLNVLIFGFDSTARNGFIRRMPKSYEYLTKSLHAVVLKGFNILGDGTPATLFPILTGKNELELPDARKKMKNNKSVEDMPFIFRRLRDDGYRTAYFEDMPWIGTFQYRFRGFRRQPADHYLRAFFLEESSRGKKWRGNNKYCVGDTPQYKLMMNLTNQFFHLDGKKFAFTFIADITHDDFNMIPTADEDFVNFLSTLKDEGHLENTLLFVMGDHGPRYANVRNTYQGKLEERLPLMAVVLPATLRHRAATLRHNAQVLTTPHDIHATLLDAMGLGTYKNDYKVAGADLPRAMSLFEPIPARRSCSEAGIEPHWCACVSWRNLSRAAPLYDRAALALVHYINGLTEPVRSQCAPRTLSSVSWVMSQQADSRVLSFVGAKDNDGYVGKFGDKVKLQRETYQVKLTVAPGSGDFEASLTYIVSEDKFHVDIRDISRTNRYGNEPDCISKTHPHLNPYCYCVG